MKGIRILTAMVSMAGLAVVAGCGGGVSGGTGAGDAVAKSQGCVVSSCHGSMASAVTGRAIGEEWRASTHFTSNVAGCTTCHGHSHQTGCASCHGGGVPQNVQQNALDAEAKCKECHVSGASLMKALNERHLPPSRPYIPATSTAFNSYTTAGYFVLQGTPYESRCIWCHNPHDSRPLPQHGQWAESGHGETKVDPFVRYDFKTRGSNDANPAQSTGAYCVRCHTATGFVNFVSSGLADVRPWGTGADGKSIGPAKQVLYCNVCHDNGSGKSYGYNLRTVTASGAGMRLYYNFSSSGVNRRIRIRNLSVDYPNVGVSDRCVLCHSGRTPGKIFIQYLSATDLDNPALGIDFTRINGAGGPHDFASGGIMFRATGYEFPGRSYGQPTGVLFAHDRIGVGNYQGTGSRGPCVTCHMSSGESHSFLPVRKSGTAVTQIATSLCTTCHKSGGLGFSNFSGSLSHLNVKKSGSEAARKALGYWATTRKIDPVAGRTRTNWLNSESCVPVEPANNSAYAVNNLGSYSNNALVQGEPGAYVHNDLYAKRLLYDTLDWLSNCSMDNDVESAINTAASLTAEEKTRAVKYLLSGAGGSRPGGN